MPSICHQHSRVTGSNFYFSLGTYQHSHQPPNQPYERNMRRRRCSQPCHAQRRPPNRSLTYGTVSISTLHTGSRTGSRSRVRSIPAERDGSLGLNVQMHSYTRPAQTLACRGEEKVRFRRRRGSAFYDGVEIRLFTIHRVSRAATPHTNT
jgi:hypothetical protein